MVAGATKCAAWSARLRRAWSANRQRQAANHYNAHDARAAHLLCMSRNCLVPHSLPLPSYVYVASPVRL